MDRGMTEVSGALGGDDFDGRWGAIESERDGESLSPPRRAQVHPRDTPRRRRARAVPRDKKTTCSSGDTLPAGQVVIGIEDTTLDLTGRSLDAKVVSCRPGHPASGH